MTDTESRTGIEADREAPPTQYEYVEEVVEYKDTRRVRVLLAIILALLALLFAFFGYRVYQAQKGPGNAPTLTTEGMVWVSSIYGWGETLEEQILSPNSVAIGPDGLIWTNSSNSAAVAFNPDGTFDRILQPDPSAAAESSQSLTPGSGSDAVGIDKVFSLDVDSDNNLYVCDNARGNILQFSPEATLKQGWSTPGVNKIAANTSRVVALGIGGIGVFDSKTGDTYFQFGTRGRGELQFDNPFGAHIDEDNNVYVADTMNRRVRKFDPEGNLIWETGTPPPVGETSHNASSTADSVFQLPTGLTTDGNGRVVVTDAFNYQIVVLNGETGEVVNRYGDYGAADGYFNNPSAIAYDKDRDWFVVADTENNRLQIVRIEGSASNQVQAAVKRLFDRPVWICCLPFLILLIAAIVVLVSRRRRKQEELPGTTPVAGPTASA